MTSQTTRTNSSKGDLWETKRGTLIDEKQPSGTIQEQPHALFPRSGPYLQCSLLQPDVGGLVQYTTDSKAGREDRSHINKNFQGASLLFVVVSDKLLLMLGLLFSFWSTELNDNVSKSLVYAICNQKQMIIPEYNSTRGIRWNTSESLSWALPSDDQKQNNPEALQRFKTRYSINEA